MPEPTFVMHSDNQRDDLQPQADSGLLRSYALALLVHLLLAAALTWGVSWKSQNPDSGFSAELWSATPQEAAPPLAEPAPAQAAEPPPAPSAAAQAAAEAQAQAEVEAEIALQRERQRKRLEADALKKAEKAKADKEQADKAKALAEKTEKDKARKAQEAAAQAKAKAAKDAEAKQQAKEQTKEQAAAEKLRQQNIARMMGMAGGTGAPDAKGTAAQASGPSASYGGRVRARIKPNVVFTEEIVGNPVAEVEVRTSLDGTIISQRLIKSSGNRAWDDAVIKAIIRTEVLPRDVDGRVPTPLIISFRPKD